MTTIAANWHEGVMVCDSKMSDSHGTWSPTQKIFRIDGDMYGFAGFVQDRDAWLKWHVNGREGKFPKLEGFEALVLRKDGLYWLGSDGSDILMERGFHAIGTGGSAALAVMLAGHDAKTAVKIACEIDILSGGKVRTHRYKRAVKCE